MFRARSLPLLPAFCSAFLGCGSSDAPNPPDAGHDRRTGDAQSAPSAEAGQEGATYYPFPCLGVGERAPTFEATFEAIYLDIFCTVGCTDGYCHGPRGGWGGLTLTSIEGAYASLIEQPTGDLVPVDGRDTCRQSDLLRVVPGDPEHSLLYLKVTGTTPCGTSMPPPDSGRRALTAEERAQVRDWIAQGAPLSAP